MNNFKRVFIFILFIHTTFLNHKLILRISANISIYIYILYNCILYSIYILKQYFLADCEPVSLWALMRHGKRNPSINFFRDMQTTLFIKDYIVSSYEKGNSTLCAQDIDNLRSWVIEEEMSKNINQLSDEGYEDMIRLGKRIKQTFPKILNELSRGDYKFASLKHKRIQTSLEAYVKGLGNTNLYIEPPKDGFDILAVSMNYLIKSSFRKK